MVDDDGNANFNTRRYQAAVIQTDVVLNKIGWHYPQQRFLTLWEDVAHTIAGDRAPQPFFFRSNTDDTIEFWHTNLVPIYYELDDFQVRTPTDVIGQHIHIVKFDVTSSDGAANGFNYEDGTFSPDEVRDRINAINRPGGPTASHPACSSSTPDRLRRQGRHAEDAHRRQGQGRLPAPRGRRRRRSTASSASRPPARTGTAPRPPSSAGTPTRC